LNNQIIKDKYFAINMMIMTIV